MRRSWGAFMAGALVVASSVALSACALDEDGLGLFGAGDGGSDDASASIRENDAGSAGGEGADASGALEGGGSDASIAADGAAGGADGGAHPDADPPTPDASCKAYCNGQCVSSCTGCSAGEALCASTKQCGNCAGCTDGAGNARPIACFACDANRKNPVGTCEPNDRAAYCLNAQYGSARHCGCSNYDVSLCPGDNQICVDDGTGVPVCVTCGEPGTDNVDCKSGKCHANGGGVPKCQ